MLCSDFGQCEDACQDRHRPCIHTDTTLHRPYICLNICLMLLCVQQNLFLYSHRHPQPYLYVKTSVSGASHLTEAQQLTWATYISNALYHSLIIICTCTIAKLRAENYRWMQLTASSSCRVESQPTTSVHSRTLKATSAQDQVTSNPATVQTRCWYIVVVSMRSVSTP